MIPIKTITKIRYGPDYGRPDKDFKMVIQELNSQIKKPHLKMIPIKTITKIRYRPDYGRPDKDLFAYS